MKRASCDRLDTSRYGLVVITLVSVIAFAVMTVLTIHSHGDSRQTTQMWITCLALHSPAVLPSGHSLVQLKEILGHAGFSNIRAQRSYGYYSLVTGEKA